MRLRSLALFNGVECAKLVGDVFHAHWQKSVLRTCAAKRLTSAKRQWGQQPSVQQIMLIPKDPAFPELRGPVISIRLRISSTALAAATFAITGMETSVVLLSIE